MVDQADRRHGRADQGNVKPRHATHPLWRSGNVVGRINEVTLRRARLVLGWVTVFGGQTTSVFRQSTRANSASYPQRDGK